MAISLAIPQHHGIQKYSRLEQVERREVPFFKFRAAVLLYMSKSIHSSGNLVRKGNSILPIGLCREVISAWSPAFSSPIQPAWPFMNSTLSNRTQSSSSALNPSMFSHISLWLCFLTLLLLMLWYSVSLWSCSFSGVPPPPPISSWNWLGSLRK